MQFTVLAKAHRTALVATLTACALAVGVLAFALRPHTAVPSHCTPTATSEPSCGAWWGAALHASDSHLVSAVSAREQTTRRRLDIVHTYHRWYDTFPTANEVKLARSGHLLFTNWEPVDRNGARMKWSSIASGSQDQAIKAEAARLAALGVPVLVSFSHEPEKDFHLHGSASDFAAAFRHVVDESRKAGASNVRWVWNVMGLSDPVWLARYRQMWPGNSYVDWVAWDPYNFASCGKKPWHNFDQTVRPFYDWLEANSFGEKPFMLAEYGTIEGSDAQHGKASWLNGVPSALQSLPNLHALVYFDLPAPPANCNWQISTSPAATKAFGVLARSGPFQQSARQSPLGR